MIREGRYISLIKAAGKTQVLSGGGELLGKALLAGGRGVKGTHKGLGQLGSAVAKGMKIDPKKGEIVGKAILPTAGAGAAAETEKGKRLRAQYGVLTPSEYGGSF